MIGAKYLGKCRNSDEAVWNGKFFIYYRYKYGSVFEEGIPHPDDGVIQDVFQPQKMIDDGIIKKTELKIGNYYISKNDGLEYVWDGRFFFRNVINCYGREKNIKKIHPEDSEKNKGRNFSIMTPVKFVFEYFTYNCQ